LTRRGGGLFEIGDQVRKDALIIKELVPNFDDKYTCVKDTVVREMDLNGRKRNEL